MFKVEVFDVLFDLVRAGEVALGGLPNAILREESGDTMRFMIIVGYFELFKESANRSIRGGVDRFRFGFIEGIPAGVVTKDRYAVGQKREGGRGELSFRGVLCATEDGVYNISIAIFALREAVLSETIFKRQLDVDGFTDPF